MVHDDYKEMIPAHALSALDVTDERTLAEHLAECAECRSELADWEATAAGLALSASPLEPSPQVRDRILSQVQAEKTVAPFKPAPRNIWRSFGSLGAIAAVVLFIALIVTVVMLWQRNRELQRSDQFVQLLNSPGARVAELSGTKEATSATAKIAYDKTGHAMLMTSGLPRAPQGKEYQLWFIVENKPPMPGKSFSTDNAGRSMMEDHVPDAALDSAVFAITLEPAGGVNAPTGAVYLRSGL